MKHFIYAMLAAIFTFSTAQAEVEPGTYYGTIGAVLESEFAFASGNGKLDQNTKYPAGNEAKGSGWYIGAGYVFNDSVNFELGYTDSNDYENSAGPISEVNTLEASALIYWRVESPIAPYVRVGLYHTETTQTGPDAAITDDHSDDNVLYGVGFDWMVRDNAALRFDYTPGSIDDDDFERLMIGLVVNFD
ncbi:MAG: outer membrane beta-barrel protein [Parvibaculales bacterium]